MAISETDRKALWALSGNECARCEAHLVTLPEAQGDKHAIVGRECHIVARSLAGPRGEEDPRGGIDEYANLILLCANCHAVIDGQPERWTPEELRRMKREHEQKVARRGASTFDDIQLRGRSSKVALRHITSGDDLLAIVGGAYSYVHEPPPRMSTPQREIVGDFLQSVQDWGEIYGDIGPKGHIDAGGDLQGGIETLREEGLVVYATTRQLTLVGTSGSESAWPEAVVRIVHEHDVRAS